RARITQIMNLLNLAPEIQEDLLHPNPAASPSNDPAERRLRKLVSLVGWREQQQLWRRWRSAAGTNFGRAS
ncbi:MAG: hypothetical protein ACP5U2_11370, partial [Bryobacteraceae bacterium]